MPINPIEEECHKAGFGPICEASSSIPALIRQITFVYALPVLV